MSRSVVYNVVIFSAFIVFNVAFTEARSPILIVPGIEGSQLFKIRQPCQELFNLCYWEGAWVGVDLCTDTTNTVQDLALVYDSTTGSFQNQSGLGIKVSGFGDTCKVEYLAANPVETDCSLQLPLGAYFSTMVGHYAGLGYKRGSTIRAAPYDWRLSPVLLQASGYYANVKSLIQTMYAAGGNKKVTIVAHSMGGPVSLYFLNNVVTQQWKNTYINAFIPIAGAWSGGGLVLKLLISGYAPNELLQINDICHFPSDLDMIFRGAARTFPSTALLLPKPSVWGNTVLVTTPNRNYTANDYAALYTDIGYPQGYSIYTGITAINAGFPAPNVPVHCFYGTGVQTPQKFIYDSGFPNTAPQIVNGDGDGTVNVQSSQVCLSWKSQQSPFTNSTFPGADHVGILQSSAVLSAIDAVVLNVEAETGLLTSSSSYHDVDVWLFGTLSIFLFLNC